MMTLHSASAKRGVGAGTHLQDHTSALPATHVSMGSMTMSLLPRFMLSTIQWPNVPSELATTGLLPQMSTYSGGVPARIVVAVGEELGVVADEQAARLQRRAEDAGSVARLAGKEPGAVVGRAEVLRHERAVAVDVAAGALRDPDGLGAVRLDDGFFISRSMMS